MERLRERIKKIRNEQLEIKGILEKLSSQLSVPEMRCYVCTDPSAVPDMVASPCGHNGICKKCALYIRTCPVCRTRITNFIKIFYV
tara:strand:+ start:309 stop:566 length:258 start_codon:yes stop_codon:yes gene_type:complete